MQLVGFERAPDAALLAAEGGAVERIPLERGEQLTFALGERHCAGMVTGADHHPCPRPETPRCPDHADTWICARCRGTCLKDEMDCFEEHAVYLAVVAPAHRKVGVTRASRLRTRLLEQGADRCALIHRVANGRIAREIETEIATEIPDRIPTTAKIDGLTRSVDEERWESLVARFDPIERFEPAHPITPRDAPTPETIACGRVVGTKGRLLVLELGGTTYVTDLRDLVGYQVTSGTPSPDRQAGLEAFS